MDMMRDGGISIIYIISEIEHLGLLAENAFRVLVTADVDSIKQRFAKRLNGVAARSDQCDDRKKARHI